MKKIIAIGLAPNIQKDDALLSLRQLFSPWSYIHGKAIKQLEHWFEQYFQISHAVSFVNARSALYAILKCLDIGSDNEIVLQAFTCAVVPNSIIAVGAKPVYVDIDGSLNMDVKDLEKKITKKTKAILLQHTFGIAANMDGIIKIARKYKLFIIEDAAHTIGGKYKGQKLGTLGDAAIFSFGRDKAFSSVFGGIAITHHDALGQNLRAYQKQRDFPSVGWVFSQLFYPIISYIILKFYYFFSLGKLLHFILRKIHFFSMPVEENEKKGLFNPLKIKKFPNVLAALALLQLKKLNSYNLKREMFTAMYKRSLDVDKIETFAIDENPLLRFPIPVGDKEDMKLFFAKQGIYIGDWYNQVIDPVGVDLGKVYYKKGSCPNAEEIVQHVMNLPTYPTMEKEDVERVIKVLKEYVK